MIDKLEFLIALARERHFGRAAESCGVTQPTLSAGLKQLEDILGLPLVERSSRFRGFTPEGERVLDWARRIVGDARAMRKEIEALKRGLAGHLRLAVIPTAIPVTADLTAPFAERHPEVGFTVLSRSSVDILGLLENLEIDAGVTYLDNEPLGRVHAIPLYRERYRLLIPSSFPLARQERVTWAEAARAPLCLLTPDMQNRRIIDALLKEAGMTLSPSLESNSLITLFAHVATGRWASVMPAKLADFFGLAGDFRSIPIVGPDVSHAIGLVVPPREPMTPLTAALARYARAIAPTLDADWDEIAVRAR